MQRQRTYLIAILKMEIPRVNKFNICTSSANEMKVVPEDEVVADECRY